MFSIEKTSVLMPQTEESVLVLPLFTCRRVIVHEPMIGSVGVGVGSVVGAKVVGIDVGRLVGLAVGVVVGRLVGLAVGVDVG
jgi:hypothetical protein